MQSPTICEVKRIFSMWAGFFCLLNILCNMWAPAPPVSPSCPHSLCKLSHLSFPRLEVIQGLSVATKLLSVFWTHGTSKWPLLSPHQRDQPPATPHHCKTPKPLPQNSVPTFTAFSPLLPTPRENSVQNAAVNKPSQMQNHKEAYCS